jgi:hypothetical protein
MAAVAPAAPAGQTGGFNTRAQEVSRRMLVAMHKAGLRNDPYGELISSEAQAIEFWGESLGELDRLRQPVRDEELRRAVVQGIDRHADIVVRTMGWRNVLIGAALLVAAVLIGGGAGYWLRGEAPVLVGVRAGAEHCEDRNDGSRLCWIPVYERLPPGH